MTKNITLPNGANVKGCSNVGISNNGTYYNGKRLSNTATGCGSNGNTELHVGTQGGWWGKETQIYNPEKGTVTTFKKSIFEHMFNQPPRKFEDKVDFTINKKAQGILTAKKQNS
jgi:hypothetical protein